jgi:hypothetical protein
MLPSERLRRSIANRFQTVNRTATVVCTLLVAIATADAHPEFAPSTVNHYLKLDLVAPNQLRLAYSTMVGPAPAAVWRRAADANANGTLDAAETRALGERAKKAVLAGLSLTVDGQRVVPVFAEPEVGLAGAEVAPSPFSVDLVAMVPLAAAPTHTIRLDDATVEPQLGETEVRVEESPTTRLIASHRGPTGDEKETHFLFRGPKFSALEDRSIAVQFAGITRAPAPAAASTRATHAPSRARWLFAAGAALALAALVTVLVLLGRKRDGAQRKMNG